MSMPRKHFERFDKELDKVVAKYDVTEAGKALLEVVASPEARTMNVTQICQAAGISRDSYYRLFKDERFVNAYTELCRAMLLSAAAPAAQALAAQAAIGDTLAIKMVLEMAGLYSPAATLNINQEVENKPTLKKLLQKKKS